MTQTPNLALPYIMASQAQKHITHNEALRKLDVLAQIVVKTRVLATPPISPDNGDVYIVAASPTDEWSSSENEVAAFQDEVWEFYPPREGMIAWIEDEKLAVVFNDGSWSLLIEALLAGIEMLGVNATADITNRLSITSPASLFNHQGAGHQLKVNKNSVGDTASVLFQTNWSGRAEFGTTGDDNFHVKVSPDGTAWREAITIDSNSGAVSFPNSVSPAAPFNLCKDAGRFGGSPEPQSVIAPAYVKPTYLFEQNGAAFVAGPKFIHNNSTYGGASGALNSDVDALIAKLKNANRRRYGVEFYLLDVTAGTGTSNSRTVDGVTYYLPFTIPSVPLPPELTINFYILAKSGSVLAHYSGAEGRLLVDGMEYTTPQVIAPADGWKQVTRRIQRTSADFAGYNIMAHEFFCTPSAQFYIAAWTVTPGHLPVGSSTYHGVVPSLETWR